MNALNTFLFVAFPYAAILVFVFGVAYRYRQEGFTVNPAKTSVVAASAEQVVTGVRVDGGLAAPSRPATTRRVTLSNG